MPRENPLSNNDCEVMRSKEDMATTQCQWPSQETNRSCMQDARKQHDVILMNRRPIAVHELGGQSTTAYTYRLLRKNPGNRLPHVTRDRP